MLGLLGFCFKFFFSKFWISLNRSFFCGLFLLSCTGAGWEFDEYGCWFSSDGSSGGAIGGLLWELDEFGCWFSSDDDRGGTGGALLWELDEWRCWFISDGGSEGIGGALLCELNGCGSSFGIWVFPEKNLVSKNYDEVSEFLLQRFWCNGACGGSSFIINFSFWDFNALVGFGGGGGGCFFCSRSCCDACTE